MDDSYSRSKTSEHKRVIKCPNCNKTFKYYSRLQTHLDRKTPCNPVITIKDDYRFEKAQKERRVCEFCNRTFKSNQTMKIHLKKNCPIAPTGKNGIVGIEILNKHLEYNIEQHSADNIQHSGYNGQYSADNIRHSGDNGQHSANNIRHSGDNGQHSADNIRHSGDNGQHSADNIQHSGDNGQHSADINGNNNITNNNITNINSNNNTYNNTYYSTYNNTYNITIQSHGNENLSYITEDDVASIFNSSITKKMIKDIKDGDPASIDAAVNEILRKLVETVYNNTLHPENYNIFIPSVQEFICSRDKKIMTYKNDIWAPELCTDVYASITDTIIHKLIQYKHPMYTTYTPVIDKLIRVRVISEKLLYPVINKVKILLEQFGLVPHT